MIQMKLNQEAKIEIQRLRDIICTRQEELKNAERSLEDFISTYMTEHDMWNSSEDLIEIIEQLPKGFLRFKMYERFYSLLELDEPDK